MEDEHVKPLKISARRGAVICVAAASGFFLAACSAGQITQTSDQVAAVDGASADSEDGTVVVRDVTVHVTKDGEAGVKFTAINQDVTNTTHELKSISVDGTEVTIDGETSIKPQCSLVADIESEMDLLTEPKNVCVSHVITSMENPGFALAGNKEVTFTFDNAEIITMATVSEPVLVSGSQDRETGAEKHSH
ncbi:hypothetical protein [Corynebacterium mustelae]|uniref:hypothetical protein n=1 Tax=Corynebacterium mustelae TaxID=571915 RepID=UPI00064124DB|nr:hypothetical protein [Corynebacterium mustelae]